MDAQSQYQLFYGKEDGKKRFEEAKRYMDGDATAAAKEGFTKLVFASSDTSIHEIELVRTGPWRSWPRGLPLIATLVKSQPGLGSSVAL